MLPSTSADQRVRIPLAPERRGKADASSIGRTKRRSKEDPEVGFRRWAEGAFEALRWSLTRLPARMTERVLSEAKEGFVKLYSQRMAEGSAVAWMKFHSSYCFAFAMDQKELPESPDGLSVPDQALKASRGNGHDVRGVREDDGAFAPGKLQSLFKRIMACARAGSKPYQRVAYDVLMCKVGCPEVPQTFVQKAILDHRKALSTPRTWDFLYTDQFFLTREVFVEAQNRRKQIRQRIEEVVHHAFAHTELSEPDCVPSLNACLPETHCGFRGGRSDGGACGYLSSQFMHARPEWDTGDLYLDPWYLVGMVEVYPGEVREVFLPDNFELVEAFQSWIDERWRNRLGDRLRAAPVAICEPLKVRMITKGEPEEYYRCLDFQKLMHRALRRVPVFEWIGKPIDDDSWDKAFRSSLPLPEGVKFCSGDYKAATDGLDPSLSEWTWTCICREVSVTDPVPDYDLRLKSWLLGQEDSAGSGPFRVKRRLIDYHDGAEYRLGLKALTGHRLEYGPKTGLESVDQAWGQLMGSPMSFPILCIVNAAVCSLGMGLEWRGDLPLRVNGDDCVFPCDQEGYERWEHLAYSVGLRKSVGKNYYSDRFAIMNSELRRLNGDHWRLEGWINQALARGRNRKGTQAGKASEVSFAEVGPNLHGALYGVESEEVRDRVVQMALAPDQNLGRSIRRAPPMVSWYADLEHGGLGVPCSSVDAKLDKGPRQLTLMRRVIASYCQLSGENQEGRPQPSMAGDSSWASFVLKELRRMIPSAYRTKEIPQDISYWQHPLKALSGRCLLTYILPMLHTQTGDEEYLRKNFDNVPQDGVHSFVVRNGRLTDDLVAKEPPSIESRDAQLRRKWIRWLGPAIGYFNRITRKGEQLDVPFDGFQPLAKFPPQGTRRWMSVDYVVLPNQVSVRDSRRLG